MKTIACLTLLCVTASAAPDHTAWQWEQPIVIETTGIARIDLPPATLDASQPSLADLRLISPDGVETPWLLDQTTPPRITTTATTDFKATLAARQTILTSTHNLDQVDSLLLETPAREFLKSALVEGSKDGITWSPLATGEVVFRQPGAANRLRIPFKPTAWPHLRVTLDDDRSKPVPFTGMSVTPAATRPETIKLPLPIISREESTGETLITFDLGAKNLHLAELILEAPDGIFSRACKVAIGTKNPDGTHSRRTIASSTIYRVLGENGASTADLTIPLNQRIPTDRLLLIIDNGDSPPLSIPNAAAARYPDRLLFYATETGSWKLLAGNRHAAFPNYDLTPLRAELTRTPGTRITPGPLAAKPDHQAPPTLPGVEAGGSTIDLSDWGFSRTVDAKLPGVIRIELDPATLSHITHNNLADLRLIQNGNQIPWLAAPSPPLRSLPVQVIEEPDPKRPTVSRWKIEIPFEGLPLSSITAESPDPLFTRHIRLLQTGKDDYGNPWNRVLASGTWTQSPGDTAQPMQHTLDCKNTRATSQLWIEADNGDNPPIHLENLAIHYRAPSIVAKITAASPVLIYYQNPRASLPVYDLSLVRKELLAADTQPATLGPEEILKPGKRRSDRDISSGSPWLWLALAAVVIALLAIVAKLLPKEPAG